MGLGASPPDPLRHRSRGPNCPAPLGGSLAALALEWFGLRPQTPYAIARALRLCSGRPALSRGGAPIAPLPPSRPALRRDLAGAPPEPRRSLGEGGRLPRCARSRVTTVSDIPSARRDGIQSSWGAGSKLGAGRISIIHAVFPFQAARLSSTASGGRHPTRPLDTIDRNKGAPSRCSPTIRPPACPLVRKGGWRQAAKASRRDNSRPGARRELRWCFAAAH